MGVKLGLSHRKKQRLGVFENWVLGKVFVPESVEQETGENCVRSSFMTCTAHQCHQFKRN